MSMQSRYEFLAAAHFATSQTTYTLNTATKRICGCYFAPGSEDDSISITHIGVPVTGHTGTIPTFRASLQGMSGLYPDGVVKNVGGLSSATFIPPALSNFVWVELDTPYVTAIGEDIAGVIDYNGDGVTTPSGSDYVTFGQRAGTLLPGQSTDPSNGYFDGSNWGKSYGAPCVCIKLSDGRVLVGGIPAAVISYTWVNATIPRVGSLWTPQENVRCVGMVAAYSQSITKALFRLRDADDNLLRSILVDSTVIKGMNYTYHIANWGPVILPRGEPVRLLVEMDTASINLYGAWVSSLADGALISGGLQGTLYVASTELYTDYNTEPVTTHPVYYACPIIDGIGSGGISASRAFGGM